MAIIRRASRRQRLLARDIIERVWRAKRKNELTPPFWLVERVAKRLNDEKYLGATGYREEPVEVEQGIRL